MADTVKVPGLGPVPKKEATIGLVVVAVLIGVYYYRSRSSSSAATTAAAAATSTDQYPPDGTVGNPQDPYSTDPATNTTYGDEASGSGGTYGAYGSGADSGLYYDPATGAYDLTSPYGTSSTGTGSTGSGGPPFSDNSSWLNWAIQQVQANDPSVNVDALNTALGLYLNGQPVDAAQQTLIFDATNAAGNPPVAGSGNYPPQVKLNGTKGGHTQAAVPNVVGQALDAARPALRQAGFAYNVSDTETGSVTAQSPKGGTQANKGSTVKLTVKKSTVHAGPVGKK